MSTRKVLNKKRLFYVIIVSILVVLFAVVGVKVGMDVSNTKPKQVKKQLDEITPYGYKLDDRDTAIYKKYFESLDKVLKEKPIDNEKYAKGLTKLFIVDFYTLDNKLASTDVGGLEFIHKNLVENFKLHAQETVYKTIKSNLYGEREQELPIVSEVVIDKVTKSTFVYNEGKITIYWGEMIYFSDGFKRI